MAVSSRSTQFTKLHRTLKKHYKPVSVNADRPVLEHLVFACLLEDTHHNLAEEAYAALTEEYFDWNEIRVSSPRELTESMARLADPPAAASRLKRVLQHVFEASYSFDLESLRKKNLGPAADALKKIDGTTAFSVAYVVQSALGGHAIPLDVGTLEVMRILGLATDKEVEKSSIAGLERAISKNKGIEFGSLLHQLGADFTVNPFSSDLRSKLQEIEPEAKKRWPKRRSAKAAAKEAKAKEEAEKAKAEAKLAAKKREKKAAAKKKPTTKKATARTQKKATTKGKTRGGVTAKKKSSGRSTKRKPR